MRTVYRFICISALLIGSFGCGGGGGGDDDVLKAANVFLDAEPDRIDIGDRILLRVHIENVDDSGVIIKLRFEDDLSYIAASSFLDSGDGTFDVNPIVGPTLNDDDNFIYLAYYLSRDEFGDGGSGELTLELRGEDREEEVEIAVDTDLHDPTKTPSSEFDAGDPHFGEEDSLLVEIAED